MQGKRQPLKGAVALAVAGVALVLPIGLLLRSGESEPEPSAPAGVPHHAVHRATGAGPPTPTATATPMPVLPGDVVGSECSPGAPTGRIAGAAFIDSFDGDPSAPEPWCPPDWDVLIHSRDVDTWNVLEPVAAGHGPQCEAPPATHSVIGYEHAVHRCRDHLMTAINASGYGVIYLTPAYIADFSEGEVVVSWEMSTASVSDRDFVDVWVTPYQDSLVIPLDDWLPDAQGEPRNAVQVRMDSGWDGPIFRVKVVRDFEAVEVPGNWWTSYTSVLVPDAARRERFELRLSRTHVRFGMPDYGLWWVDAPIAPLAWDQGVVQFGHHSYNPFKDGNGGPNTWHWDDIAIRPARAFTTIRARERFVSGGPATLTFDRPAPAGAHLRFAGAGSIDVSFDEGRTWFRAARQAEELAAADHFSSYWQPIPEGTSNVRIRGEPRDWFRHWAARDFAIWAPPGP